MHKVGDFEVVSGEINVGDPCYGGDRRLTAMNGRWQGFVEYSDEGSWGTRVAVLLARHADYNNFLSNLEEDGGLGVDSGQMSVVDNDIAADCGEGLYDDICKATLAKESAGLVSALDDEHSIHGVASSTGFGDGFYPLFVAKNDDGEAIAVKVVFIDDEPVLEEAR